MAVAEVDVGEILEGNAVRAVLSADGERRSAPSVAGGVDAVLCQNQDGHGAVDALLHILQALLDGILLADESRHELGRVDPASAHLEKMGAAVLVDGADELVGIVDLADGRDGKAAEMGLHEQRLGVAVGNAADAEISLKLLDVPLELRAEGGILNVVNRAGEAVRPVYRHTAALRSQMGMVIRSEEEIQNAARFRCYSKKSAHAIITSVVSAPSGAG